MPTIIFRIQGGDIKGPVELAEGSPWENILNSVSKRLGCHDPRFISGVYIAGSVDEEKEVITSSSIFWHTYRANMMNRCVFDVIYEPTVAIKFVSADGCEESVAIIPETSIWADFLQSAILGLAIPPTNPRAFYMLLSLGVVVNRKELIWDSVSLSTALDRFFNHQSNACMCMTISM